MPVSTTPKFNSSTANNAIIENALQILSDRIKQPCDYITGPNDIKTFLKLKLSGIEHEVFSVIFMDTRHGVLKFEEMFRGTIDGASVYPREVVKAALACNASAVIFAHKESDFGRELGEKTGEAYGHSRPSMVVSLMGLRLPESNPRTDS